MAIEDKKTATKRKHLFQPGNPGGPGRPKGSGGRQQVARMVQEALDKVGGIDYLVEQAQKNPKGFLMLLAKLMPKQIDAQVDFLARLRSMSQEELEERLLELMTTVKPLPPASKKDLDQR